MVRARGEQRNGYEGIPQRPWVTALLVDREQTTREVRLVVDTGSPCGLIVSSELLRTVWHDEILPAESNFGTMLCGLVRVVIPRVGVDARVVGYGSDTVVHATKQSHRSFDGLLGLPLLRMTEYGGDADFFWLREATR